MNEEYVDSVIVNVYNAAILWEVFAPVPNPSCIVIISSTTTSTSTSFSFGLVGVPVLAARDISVSFFFIITALSYGLAV